MKKVMLVLMLGVFIFGSSGFTVEPLPGQDCDEFAAEKYNEALDNGWSQNVANFAYFGYYWACMYTEGESSNEVTIVAN
jgi:hypothetical protein